MSGHHPWKDILRRTRRQRRWYRRLYWFLRNLIWGGYRQGGIVGAYYWILGHTFRRYHVIKLSGQDDYRWGWIDRDYAMLLACFKLLVDYVEKEDPMVGLRKLKHYKSPDRDFHPDEVEHLKEQLKAEAELRALFDWWTKDRPRRSSDPTVPFVDGWDEDQKMLRRLIEARGSMWT